MQGLQSAHGVLQRAVARELRLKHTPTLEFVYDDTAERGMRITELIEPGGGASERAERRRLVARARARRAARRRALRAHDARAPRRRRARARSRRCSRCSARWARTPSRSCRRTSSRCRTSTASSSCRSSSPRCRTTSTTARSIFLDCGNIDRNPADALKQAARILNIDHHHDNTRFGTVDHVVPQASCTAEVIWDLMRGLGVELTQPIAEALYVGLVTDTGRFMYENTGSRAHVMAAELIGAGIDVHAIYRRLYEGVPQGKLELLARGLSAVERFDGGLLTVTHLTREDYAVTGADESYSEGVVDHLRSVEGTAVAGLVRELLSDGAATRRKVSLRATDDRVDVSVIARALGGGGHRRAAGFSTDMEFPELVAFLRARLAEQL